MVLQDGVVVIVLVLVSFFRANALPIVPNNARVQGQDKHKSGNPERPAAYHVTVEPRTLSKAEGSQNSYQINSLTSERPSVHLLKRAPPTPDPEGNLSRDLSITPSAGQGERSSAGKAIARKEERGVFTVELVNAEDRMYMLKTWIGDNVDKSKDRAFMLAVDTGSSDILVYGNLCKALRKSGKAVFAKDNDHRVYTPAKPLPAAARPVPAKPATARLPTINLRQPERGGPIAFEAGFRKGFGGNGNLIVDWFSVDDSEPVLQWFGCMEDLGNNAGTILQGKWDGIFGLSSTSLGTQFENLPTDKLPGYMSWIASSIYWKKNKMRRVNAVVTLDLLHSAHEGSYKSSMIFGKCACETTAQGASFELDGSGNYEFVANGRNSKTERTFLLDSGSGILLLFDEFIKPYIAEAKQKGINIMGPYPYNEEAKPQPGYGEGIAHYEVDCSAKLPNFKLELLVQGKSHSFEIPGESLIYRDQKAARINKKLCKASFCAVIPSKPDGPKFDYGLLGIPFLHSLRGCFRLYPGDIPQTPVVPESDSDSSRPASSQGAAKSENIPPSTGVAPPTTGGTLRRRLMEPESTAGTSTTADELSDETTAKHIFTYCAKDFDVLALVK